MKNKNTGHPTREILAFAQSAPGGLIRWHEARDIYLSESEAARRDERRAERFRKLNGKSRNGNCNYHMSLHQLLKRHFYKVDGTDGYYVLKHTVFNDSWAEDNNALRQFIQTYGINDVGQSAVDIPYMGALLRRSA
jgi:hypothetical protein